MNTTTQTSTTSRLNAVFGGAQQHLVAMGLAASMALATVAGMDHLADRYQHDAQMAAVQAAPAAQQVVVVGQRAIKG
jgi:hypothetical protein